MSTVKESAESSDLDDLLDEAMDIVNEEERKHEEEVKVRDAELNEKINAALEEKATGSDDANAEMLMANLMKLIGTLKEDGSDAGNNSNNNNNTINNSSGDVMDEESLNKLKSTIDNVIAQMENSDFLTAEDKQSIKQVQNLIAMADNDPEKVDEFLSSVDALKINQSINANCGDDSNNSNNTKNNNNGESKPGDAVNVNELQNIFAALANCQASNTNSATNNINKTDVNSENNKNNDGISGQGNAITSSTALPLPVAPSAANSNEASNMEALSEGLQTYFTSCSKPSPQTTTSSSSLASTAADSNAKLPDHLVNSATNELANMLITTFCDPEFVEPIRMMRDAYGGWLRSHESTLNAEDKERYEKQYAKTKEICEFFTVPLSADDDQRVVELMELMSQFSELGNTPEDLCNYN